MKDRFKTCISSTHRRSREERRERVESLNTKPCRRGSAEPYPPTTGYNSWCPPRTPGKFHNTRTPSLVSYTKVSKPTCVLCNTLSLLQKIRGVQPRLCPALQDRMRRGYFAAGVLEVVSFPSKEAAMWCRRRRCPCRRRRGLQPEMRPPSSGKITPRVRQRRNNRAASDPAGHEHDLG